MNGRAITLTAGVPAFQVGERLEEAVESLVSQTMPRGARWVRIVIVVSGEPDQTLRVAQRLAARDERIELVHQPRREGKASALRAIFERAEGSYLLLLNGDASAEPGAVAELLRAASGMRGAFAVMARPTLPPGPERGFRAGLAALWDLHDRVHEETLSRLGGGNHLSDELLLLPLPIPVPLPVGVVNDGAFLGGWLRFHGGRLLFARGARVRIEIPRTPAEHLRQRRRIAWGNRQIAELMGTPPTTWPWLARHDLPTAVRTMVGTVRERPGAIPALPLLAAIEIEAVLLAGWDRKVTGRGHVLWETVPPAARNATTPIGRSEARASSAPANPEGG